LAEVIAASLHCSQASHRLEVADVGAVADRLDAGFEALAEPCAPAVVLRSRSP
jgi:hypothetical protein